MAENKRHRIGLMGGTFDPIHIGHLMLAECAYEQFSLEKVLFLPAGNPPHKNKELVGAADHQRLEMVRLAISGNPHFSCDPEEMDRTGYTYTSDTLELLTARHPDTDYYFIIGADSLLAFDTWYRPDVICRNCILAAAVRNQLTSEEMQRKMKELEERFGARIYLLSTPDVDIASSSIREMKKQGRSIRYYVPDSVYEYIEKQSLYE